MSALRLEELDEWFGVCTIDRCSEASTVALAECARVYFSVCLNHVGRPYENPDERQGSGVCWQLLELRMNTGTHRSGKHYKNWLFEYSADIDNATARLNSLKSGLKLLMQATVRDYCAGLLAQHTKDQRYGVYSLDEAQGDGLSDRCLAEAQALLAEPAVDDSLVCEEAGRIAETILDTLTDRERVVLLVKWCELNRAGERRISLDHPTVLQMAGCGKSQLYAARSGLNDVLKERISESIGEKTGENMAEMLVPVVRALVERLFLQLKSEKSAEPFLTYIEEL